MRKIIFFLIIFTIIISLYYLIFSTNRVELFYNKPKGINRIDGCVYINLESRQDRKELLIKELNKMKIPKNKIHKVAGILTPNNGYKGCTQSHILGLRIGKMNNWDKTLILEDDAQLTISQEEFQKEIDKILNYLSNKNWDVITLSKANQQLEDLEDNKNSNIKKVKRSTLATAYIVKNHYLQKLIDLFEKGNQNMEYNIWRKDGGQNFEPNVTDQIWGRLQMKDNWYGFEKDPIKQREIWSNSLHNPNEKDQKEE